ncbi:MAG: hypothetical protein FWE77_04510 [Clostridia bacterium]|nr:hypothetical protein [Clostridia bacterium]
MEDLMKDPMQSPPESPFEALKVSRPPRAVWPVRFLLAKGAACATALGATALSVGYLFLPSAVNDPVSLLLAAGAIGICGAVFHSAAKRALCFLTPVRSMRTLAGCLLQALREAGFLVTTQDFRLLICRSREGVECALEGGTLPEKRMFACSLGEMLSPIDNPRYVLLRKANGKKRGTAGFVQSYACPTAMSEPQYAERLAFRLSRAMGAIEAVDTRYQSGCAILQYCKEFSYINRGASRGTRQQRRK